MDNYALRATLTWLCAMSAMIERLFVLEGESRELQVCQPDLGAREGHGADCPECDQAQPGWVWERQLLLDQPDLL